jgi:Fe-Mn family superoxide dismutase
MTGFSEDLWKNHLALYRGHVSSSNKKLEILAQLMKSGKATTPECVDLKRELGREFNGMRLHEYYFDNLGGTVPLDSSSRLAMKMIESFGSIEAWEKDFQTTGTVHGIGWVVLYQELGGGKLTNVWIDEHDEEHPAGCQPILVIDVFEHAFMLDFGVKRSEYIESIFKSINWKVVDDRLGVCQTYSAL